MAIQKYFIIGGKRHSETEVDRELLELSDDELFARNIERDKVWELRDWLLVQSNSTKLLFILHVNWDSFEPIVMELLEDPGLDRAIAARIFWGSNTFNTGHDWLDSASSIVIRNLKRGYYGTSELELSRCDLINNVHNYIEHTVPDLGPRSKKLPRELCGPFIGKLAVATQPINQTTKESLKDIFDSDSPFPLSYAKHCDEKFEFWAEKTGFLKPVSDLRLDELAEVDDTTYLEHIFGNHAAYLIAKDKVLELARQEFEKSWKPFNTAVKNGWKPKSFSDENFKPPPFWLTIDRDELRANVKSFVKMMGWCLVAAVMAVGLGLIARKIFKGEW
jgi:hypothetical protein